MLRKKLMMAALTCALAAVCVSPAAAKPPSPVGGGNGGLIDDPAMTPAVTEELHAKTEAKERALGISQEPRQDPCESTSTVSASCLPATGYYGTVGSWVSNYRQERTYWCGPAAARQSLGWHRLYSGRTSIGLPSQTTLAGRIGTTTSGSSTRNIAAALNSYSGTFGTFAYVTSNLTDHADPLNAFYRRIGDMLEGHHTIPIILTDTEYLTRYGGRDIRHYMSVSGLTDSPSAGPVKMRSVDPNYDTAYFGVQSERVGCKTTNGLFRACWYADAGGTNGAMCW